MGGHIDFVYETNKHQAEFQADVMTKFLHLSGGFGSGKSYALVMKAFQLSYLNRMFPGGLLCPSFPDFKNDVEPLFEEILEDHQVKYSFKRKEYKFPWATKPLYVVSGRKRLRGPNWGYALINELTLIEMARYKEVMGRVRIRGAPCPQIASGGTPEGLGTDYYEILVEKPFHPSVRVIYGRTADNAKNLADDFIPSLKAAYDKSQQDAYLEGMFVNMTGNRFYYAYSPRNEDDKIIWHEEQDVHCSMDFNVEFMTATFWHDEGHHLDAFDEIVIPNNASIRKMTDAMKAKGYRPENTTIFPDPSGNKRNLIGRSEIQALNDEGYHKVVVNPAPKMRQRQLSMNNLLEKGIIRLNPITCPSLRKDFMAVQQEPITLDKVKDNPKLTHSSDGADYYAEDRRPYSGKRTNAKVIKFR